MNVLECSNREIRVRNMSPSKIKNPLPSLTIDENHRNEALLFIDKYYIRFTISSPPILVEYNHIFILVSVGIHTPELPSVEWMDDDVQSEVKSEFTSFGNVSKNLFSSLSSFMHAIGRRDHACNIFD